jgi:hypothetical protein
VQKKGFIMLTPVLIDFKLSQIIDESDYTEGPTNMSEPKSLYLLPSVIGLYHPLDGVTNLK